jgi:cytoskeleton protein RodZ
MTTELTQPTLSAGQILSQAREQQQLTVAQVAQQLNLSKSLIEDLEQDKVDARLSSTFVRGYLRSYAKLLKIPAQQVLDAYHSNSKGLHQTPSLTRSFSKRTAKEATENRYIWVTYLVIFVFILLLVLGFWQSRFGSSAADTALPMVQMDDTILATEANAAGTTAGFTQPEVTQTGIPVTQLEPLPTAAETTISRNEDAPEFNHAGAALTGQEQELSTATAEPLLPPVSSVQTEQNTAASTEADSQYKEEVQPSTEITENPASEQLPSAMTEQPETLANAQIRLSFSAECWVDVVDATGKRLAYGSRQAGEQLSLAGVAPVKVLLGNAAAATLSFNGDNIDLSRYPTGRVARLTLGQNQ